MRWLILVWGVASSARVPLADGDEHWARLRSRQQLRNRDAEYLEPTRLNINGWIGLSWVAVWTLLFAVVIPARPLKSMLVTLASVSSVPVVIGFMISDAENDVQPAILVPFFFWIVFPYLSDDDHGVCGCASRLHPGENR